MDRGEGLLALAVTDSNGYYKVKHLPPKPCWVSRQNSQFSLGVCRMAILPRKGRSLQLNFGRGPNVSGRLVVNGNAVPDRRVVLTSSFNAALGWFRCNGVTGPQGEFQLAGAPPGRYAVYYEQKSRQGEWIKAANVEIRREDVDLGVIPEVTPDVWITIESPGEGLTVSDVSIHQGTTTIPMGQRIGIAKGPAVEGGPFVFSGLPTGRHTLYVHRGDGICFYRQIEIVPGTQPLDIYLETLEGTSSIQGRIIGNVKGVFLWNKDQTLKGWASLGKSETFSFDRLPAGQYLIGEAGVKAGMTWAEVDLVDGQAEAVNLDVSGIEGAGYGYLNVKVFDDCGIPCGMAEVRLVRQGTDVEPCCTGMVTFFMGAPGPHMLHVRCAGYKDVDEAITFDGTSKAVNRLIRLQRVDQ